MPIGKIDITVKVQGEKAIVRKTVKDHGGRFLGKYGLNKDGQWIAVVQGELYPAECILPAILLNGGDDEH